MWLLREIEARHAKVCHVVCNHEAKQADWKLPNSKTNHLTLGTIRSHCCSCDTTPKSVCPFDALLEQVEMASKLLGNSSQWIFPTSAGEKSSKLGWSKNIACFNGIDLNSDNGALRFSGHSTRSSGVQHLVKLGMDLWRVQIFGRWSSNAFLKYIRESPLENLDKLASLNCIQNQIMNAEAELQQLQESQAAEPRVAAGSPPVAQVSLDMLEEVAPSVADCEDSPVQFVSNDATGGLVHTILVYGEEIPPRHWRAKCNWHFGRGLTSFNLSTTLPAGKQYKVCLNLRREARQARPSSTSSSSSSS